MKKSPYTALLFLAFLVIGVTGGTWTSNQFGYKPSLGARGTAEKDAFDAGLDHIATRLGKEIWVGDPAYGATLQSAITAIDSNQVILRVPPGTHSIAANLSIPVNVSLKVERGAVLSVATGKTLTINGGLEAGLYPIITCTGTGTVVFGNQVPRVFVQWTGAVGNNTTDDSTAINLAATIARASACKRITLPACAGYKATAQLDFRQLNVEGFTKITTSYAGSGVLIGQGGLLSIDLNVYRVTDWTAGNTGIEICNNLDRSNLNLRSTGSEVGIKVTAGTGSTSYNNITLGELYYNKIGFMVHVPAAATGWCNENLVLGGSWNNGSTTGAECCVKLLGEGNNYIDKWTFVKPAFEIVDGTAAVITTKAQNCDFQNARYECGPTVPVALFNDQSYHIIITLGSSNHLPYFWNCATGGSYGTTGCDVRMTGDHTLHRLTDFSSFGAAYHDGTYLHVPGYEIIDAAGGTVSRKLNTTQFNLADGDGGAALKGTYSNYHCIGITVNFNFRSVSFPDNQWAKKLYIKHHWQDNATTHQQLFIKCYDSAGNVLGGTSPAYVQGNKWAAVGTGAGQLYTIQFSSPTNPIIFHGDVAKVFIGAFNYEAMNGLEIYAPYQANGYLSYTGPKELPGILYAANAPTKWHFQVGEKVLNDAAAVGAPQGWVCIKRTSTTLSANASGGDVTITVASITGIASGDIIGVKLNTGLYHFTTVNGAPAGSTVTLTAALPGTGVVATSGNAVVANLWQAMPNL